MVHVIQWKGTRGLDIEYLILVFSIYERSKLPCIHEPAFAVDICLAHFRRSLYSLVYGINAVSEIVSGDPNVDILQTGTTQKEAHLSWDVFSRFVAIDLDKEFA